MANSVKREGNEKWKVMEIAYPELRSRMTLTWTFSPRTVWKMPLTKFSSIHPSISPILMPSEKETTGRYEGQSTHHRVLAASLEAGIGGAAAKFCSPDPFMLGPLAGAPGAPEAGYSAISTAEVSSGTGEIEANVVGRT